MVILCIGTPEVIGDSVAPIVGDMLTSHNINAYIYGTTARPITGTNIHDYTSAIAAHHSGECIIAVDAALGTADEIGTIKVIRGGVSPGFAIGKNLPKIGTIAVLAQVAALNSGMLPLNTLLTVPYERVMSIANRCCKIILNIISGSNSAVQKAIKDSMLLSDPHVVDI